MIEVKNCQICQKTMRVMVRGYTIIALQRPICNSCYKEKFQALQYNIYDVAHRAAKMFKMLTPSEKIMMHDLCATIKGDVNKSVLVEQKYDILKHILLEPAIARIWIKDFK